MPKTFALITMFAFTGFTQAGEHAALRTMEPFDASYRVTVSLARGELQLSLTHAYDDVMQFKSRITPTGAASIFLNGTISEFSDFSAGTGLVKSLGYRRTDTISTKKNHNASLNFDWRNGQITGRERGEPVAFSLPPDTLDRQLIVIALMHDLSNGRCLDKYSMYDRGTIREVSVRRLALENVSIQIGDFQTLKVEHQSADGKKSTQFWMAPSLGFLPVRVNFSTSRKNLKVAGELAHVQINGAEPDPRLMEASDAWARSIDEICTPGGIFPEKLNASKSKSPT